MSRAYSSENLVRKLSRFRSDLIIIFSVRTRRARSRPISTRHTASPYVNTTSINMNTDDSAVLYTSYVYAPRTSYAHSRTSYAHADRPPVIINRNAVFVTGRN